MFRCSSSKSGQRVHSCDTTSMLASTDADGRFYEVGGTPDSLRSLPDRCRPSRRCGFARASTCYGTPVRVFGRWLLYAFVGLLLLIGLFSGGDGFGSDDPKGRWRSITLSIAGTLATLAGLAVFFAHRNSGSLGAYWPMASVLAWTVASGLTVGAWFSIANDIRGERERGQSK